MFKFGKLPSGPIATAILDCTKAATDEMDWSFVFTAIELIKERYQTNAPQLGCIEAMKTIRYRLDAADSVMIRRTLQVLDSLFENCGKPFVAHVATKDNLEYFEKWLKRTDILSQDRDLFKDMIAGWAYTVHDPVEIRNFFEKLLRLGYVFSPATLEKFPVSYINRVMPPVPPQNISPQYVGWNHQQVFIPQPGFGSPQPAVYLPTQQLPPPPSSVLPSQMPPAPHHKPQINAVSPQEREKWVAFDISVAQSCTTLLQETLTAIEQEGFLVQDISENPIASEAFHRCCDILGRIVALVPLVREPRLVEKLVKASREVGVVLERYNRMRGHFLKRGEGEGTEGLEVTAVPRSVGAAVGENMVENTSNQEVGEEDSGERPSETRSRHSVNGLQNEHLVKAPVYVIGDVKSKGKVVDQEQKVDEFPGSVVV
ncbi:UNVERIFIED_CONTAM: hypothetical protein HDU68_011429 [Siphonaria sp. JEL0065]|nr:hypothetical protein HDU68_011429 [Siphonaria sp. JEL0065]